MSRAFWESPRHAEFRTRVREILRNAVLPHADRWEAQGHVDPEAWKTLAAQGLLSHGHHGEAFLESAILLEELGRTGYAGVRAGVGVHAYMATSYLDLFGTPAQREAYLEPARRGERLAALAITEADAGSDLSRLRTRARPREGGGLLVDGEKLYVANGSQASFFVTLVRTRDQKAAPRALTGVSLLLIDADSPGVRRTGQRMLGWRSADVCEVVFDNVAVPEDRVLGRRDHALMHIVQGLDFERLAAGLLAVGGVAHCLELLEEHIRRRRVKDTPLYGHQAVRHAFAELTADHDLVSQYGRHAAWLHSRGELDSRTATVLKLKATELAVRAAHVCLQFHGAQGCLDESTAARLYRDASAGTIAAGASELLRDLI
ncbi:acyl-CoA dehydrogenase family protein [Streptomyces parvulus]|uniref:Acyl-CoA dehydrogenase n=1 Tax=Streptomyces parvulus TaxID=146923 RepID=A0A191VAC6_9ACTN|nr:MULTISPECIES: acyl-CoA dehydrogenase family protein [Streptomyces]ANJ11828.1 acyl-CoA dehydrogenase [Streptomyces parvulus]MCC9158647.1 acyl-CoA dehydrogenase family protein [Streptomyces parvulus]MCE7691601.1 acyl-CoA dehydrogenase family protein [Streptomyces parvulus]MCQ4192481.1 acyl-CoA dehydrogenase family protein [Streptomyces parvulus]MZD58670.1 acyl-CoA dehydrogenase [Streptomyces sp. SID5606]